MRRLIVAVCSTLIHLNERCELCNRESQRGSLRFSINSRNLCVD